MDVINENVACQKAFPDNEYKKDGTLKKLRGRMLKKLLKYELRAVAPVMSVMLAILFVTTLFVCVVPGVWESEDFLLGFIPIMLYIYSLFGTMVVAVVTPLHRYEKSMFKEEGYLTLSIPATMEELVFSKHLIAVCASLLAIVCNVISVVIVMNVMGINVIVEIFDFSGMNGFEIALAFLETGLIAFSFCVLLFTASNAINCFGQRFSKKSHMVWVGVGIYALISVCGGIFGWMAGKGWFAFFSTPVGAHVGSWLIIIALVGLNVLCIWYQLRYLKKKINLK